MKSIWAWGLGAVLSVATACGDDDGGKTNANDGGGNTLPDGGPAPSDGAVVGVGVDGAILDRDGGNTGGQGSAMIGSAGGTVTSADGRLTLTIPPNAYARPTNVVIKPLTPPPAGAMGTVYEVSPAHEPFRENLPVRPVATLKYTSADLSGGQPTDLQFAIWRLGRWELLDGRVKASAMEISAELAQLGPVALIGGLCEACYDAAKTDPDKVDGPCTPESCVFGEAKTPGDCVPYGMDCTICRPKCDVDRDGFCTTNTAPSSEVGNDCNEGDPNIHPDAAELCNSVDDNCNGTTDEGCTPCATDAECTVSGQYCNLQTKVCEICTTQCAGAAGAACTIGFPPDTAPGVCFAYGKFCSRCVLVADTDGDGQVAGTGEGKDCLPDNPNAYWGAPEICGNMIDDDCSGAADDNCACTSDAGCGAGQACINGACTACPSTCEAAACPSTCKAFGNGCGRCAAGCDTDGDGDCSPGDCQPNNPAVGPNAIEVCGDMIDNDCDTHVDEGCSPCNADTDCKEGNEYCNAAGACDVCPFGCDAANCGIDPPFGSVGGMRAPGMCLNYGVGCTKCVASCDGDGDGFCEVPPAMYPQIDPRPDCGPNDAKVYPQAPERCNDIDDDCDGIVDEDCTVCTASNMCAAAAECSNSK